MANLLGYAASCAVLATFLMRTMVPLRLVAILSNLLFAAFAYVQHIYPVLRSAGHGNPHHRFDLINPAILRAARSQRSRGFNDPWLRDLLARRPFKVAAVAYAAKLARMIWAMLVTGECYRVRDRSAPKPVAA
jgi:hypothetical protein